MNKPSDSQSLMKSRVQIPSVMPNLDVKSPVLLCSRNFSACYGEHPTGDSWSSGVFRWYSSCRVNYRRTCKEAGCSTPETVRCWTTPKTPEFLVSIISDISRISNWHWGATPSAGESDSYKRCSRAQKCEWIEILSGVVNILLKVFAKYVIPFGPIISAITLFTQECYMALVS